MDDVFQFRSQLVERYSSFSRSFVRIAAPDLQREVARQYQDGRYWPEPLVQINPNYQRKGTVQSLAADGVLHPICADVFQAGKPEGRPQPLHLYAHQLQALAKGQAGRSFVVTTGTGSGKSLSFFIPVIDRILKDKAAGSKARTRAIVIYPMNALANSQLEELEKFLHGYENEEFIFQSVHHAFRFCMMTIGPSASAEFVFFARQAQQVHDERRRFSLTADEFRLINPNTLTCPVFRSKRDAELTKKIYRTAPVLIDEKRPDGNPWGINFSVMLHMSGDSHLFADAPAAGLLPLYEAKLIHQFDHRWATYEADGDNRDMTDEERVDPSRTTTTRYWVSQAEVEKRLQDKGWTRGWLMGWRDICRATDERTVIASVLPRVGVNHKTPLFFAEQALSVAHSAALLANFDSLVLDYVARQKVGGTSLAYFYLKQLPFLPPERYADADLAFIVPRVLELTYTAHDLKAWAQDLGFEGPPFAFDPGRRAEIRGELDAYYARLYDLHEDELRYILDPADVMGADYPSETFRVLKNREMKEFGEYRTQRLVLREFRRMALADEHGQPYASLLSPPPGVQALPSYSDHGVMQDETDAHLAGLLLTLIEQGQRLPRRELNDVFLLAGQTELHERLLDVQGLALVRNFMQSHVGVFEAARVAGERLHQWLRHFETRGVIRLISAGDLVERIASVPLPAEVRVNAQTAPVATLLARAAKLAFAALTSADETPAATPSKKQA